MKIIALLIAILVSVVISSQVHAQTVQPSDTLVGLIVNKKGKAVKDVPVSIHQKKETVQTDKKGIFILPGVNLETDTLTVFLPKSKVIQVPVSGLGFIKIAIKDDQYNYVTSQAKDEIVNIGYGTQRRRNSSTSNVVISGDDLRQSGNDILSALVGKVPGLKIMFAPDGSSVVTLRGGTSVNLDNSPLYIVDGSIIESLDFVNINDVDKITILKDGSMYGVKGANGAIVVTTK